VPKSITLRVSRFFPFHYRLKGHSFIEQELNPQRRPQAS
jgi:hypothetical protein